MILRVLVAEDSRLAADLLTQVLQADGDILVVGVATDGRQAVRLNRSLAPDVVLLDLDLPVLDGLGALERMLEERPVPVLVVTAASRGQGASVALDALRRGALDLIPKDDAWSPVAAGRLRDRVRTLARVRVRARPATPAGATPRRATRRWSGPPVVGIGCSTGGPPALAEVLGRLPAGFPASVLVVQHIQEGFDATLAQWLDEAVALPVAVAGDDRALAPGVWIAPVGSHLEVTAGGRLRVRSGPLVDGHCPSASVLFQSLAAHCGPSAMGVVLTGMGSDGAEGLLALRRAGGHTVVESEATAAVYGMPRAAVACGAAEQVLRLGEVGDAMVRWARRR